MEANRPNQTAGKPVTLFFPPKVSSGAVKQIRLINVAIKMSAKLADSFQAKHYPRNRTVTRFTRVVSNEDVRETLCTFSFILHRY